MPSIRFVGAYRYGVCDRCKEPTKVVRVEGDPQYHYLCCACGGPAYEASTGRIKSREREDLSFPDFPIIPSSSSFFDDSSSSGGSSSDDSSSGFDGGGGGDFGGGGASGDF